MSTESRELPELVMQWRHNAQGCGRKDAQAAGTWRSCATQLEVAIAHSRAQDSGGEAVFRCTVCGSHCDSDGRSLHRPPAEQAAKGEGVQDIIGSMRNFADVADRCQLTEGNAPAAIRTWADMLAASYAIPQPSDPADSDALKCNHRFKPNAGYPDCDCETEAECMYGATPPTAHPQSPSVDAAAVLALKEVTAIARRFIVGCGGSIEPVRKAEEALARIAVKGAKQ